MRRFRVGTFSMGILMIGIGVMLLMEQLYGFPGIELILKWWPVILIILGLEVLVYDFSSKGDSSRIKYDIFSIFIILFILIVSIAAYVTKGLLPSII